MILSDRIAVMNAGRLEQVATPRELFENPSSLFSARFIGGRNELSGRAIAGGFEMAGRTLEGISRCQELSQRGAGASVCAFVRPEMLRVSGMSEGANALSGRIVQILFRGSKSEVMIETAEGVSLRSMMDPSEASSLRVGSEVALQFAPHDTHLFWAGPQ